MHEKNQAEMNFIWEFWRKHKYILKANFCNTMHMFKNKLYDTTTNYYLHMWNEFLALTYPICFFPWFKYFLIGKHKETTCKRIKMDVFSYDEHHTLDSIRACKGNGFTLLRNMKSLVWLQCRVNMYNHGDTLLGCWISYDRIGKQWPWDKCEVGKK